MKRKQGFIVDKIAGENVAVPVGEMSKSFHGMIKLNGTALFIWEQLENDVTEEQIADALTEAYEVDRTRAAADVARIVGALRDAGIVTED